MAIKKKLNTLPKKETTSKTHIKATKGSKTKSTTLKDEEPLDHTTQHNLNKQSTRTVGVNIGVTKNMGDFESLRVDCWMNDDIHEGETPQQAINRLYNIAVNELKNQIEELS